MSKGLSIVVGDTPMPTMLISRTAALAVRKWPTVGPPDPSENLVQVVVPNLAVRRAEPALLSRRGRASAIAVHSDGGQRLYGTAVTALPQANTHHGGQLWATLPSRRPEQPKIRRLIVMTMGCRARGPARACTGRPSKSRLAPSKARAGSPRNPTGTDSALPQRLARQAAQTGSPAWQGRQGQPGWPGSTRGKNQAAASEGAGGG